MSDVWDYRIRRMEIAWELAKLLMPSSVPATDAGKATVTNAVKEAWAAVDATYPNAADAHREQPKGGA